MDKNKNTETSNAEIIIEGMVKIRDGKKWKSRWCTLRKLSPVADFIHLQLYRDKKDWQKGNLPKASLSLCNFMGCESGFTLDKESYTLALLCKDDSGAILALAGPEELLKWKTRVSHALLSKHCSRWPAFLQSPGPKSGLKPGLISVHVRPSLLCIVSGVPPRILGVWQIADLRKYGVIDGRVCFESGSVFRKMSGPWILKMEKANSLIEAMDRASPYPKSEVHRNEKRFSDFSESTMLHFKNETEWTNCEPDLFNSSASTSDYETKILKCTSCRLSLPAASVQSPWSIESGSDRRSDFDRSSLFSQSSGTSEYSGTKDAGTREDLFVKNYTNSRSKPFTHNKHLQKAIGPYNNYDIPRPPMPLIKEYPNSVLEPLYDVPNRLRKCLVTNTLNCNCYKHSKISSDVCMSLQSSLKIHKDNLDSNASRQILVEDSNSSPNTTVPDVRLLDNSNKAQVIHSEETHDTSLDLSLYESSLNILKNAGFSQEEIESMNEICSDSSANDTTDHNTKIDVASDKHPLYQSNGNLNKRKSSSADFLKAAEECIGMIKSNSHNELVINFNALNKSRNYKNIDEICLLCKIDCGQKCFQYIEHKYEKPISKVQNSVQIRRSSSAPNKYIKNRDSSDSSDSGISTESSSHFKPRYTSVREPSQRVIMKATPTDIDKITFEFDKSYSSSHTKYCSEDTGYVRTPSRDTVSSPTSNGSELSDYLDSVSESSFSYSGVSKRCTSRPRYGNEYTTINSSLLTNNESGQSYLNFEK